MILLILAALIVYIPDWKAARKFHHGKSNRNNHRRVRSSLGTRTARSR
jgi:hypothetical protein